MSNNRIEELQKLLDKKEKEIENLQKKRLGLYWDKEKEPEQVVLDCEHNLPVLKRIKNKEITSETGEENILIEGDNFHALTCLNYTHKGKIDVIYIDPPYNTGAKDWKYNNKFVDKNDGYRHSKWLNMMEKRLILARNLLSEKGTLICAIDENEHNHLGLLLKQIFSNKVIVCVAIIHNPGGIQGKNFSYTNEFAYFVHPQNGTFISSVVRDDASPTAFRDWGKENSKRESAKTCFYPIYIKNKTIVGFGEIPHNSFHPKAANILRKDGVIEVYPIDKKGIERKWRFGRETVENIKEELICKMAKGECSIWRIKKNYRWKTVWTETKYNANIYGTKLLNNIIDLKFPYPKSLYTVMDCVSAIIHNKNATILDFFAGSGTTGHAVLQLNKEDGGNRKFILCTNNEINGHEKEFKEKYNLSNEEFREEKENKSKRFLKWEENHGICSTVTYPRIQKVIEGYKKNDNGELVEGLGGSLHYLKTEFVKKTKSVDQTRINLTQKCTQMLCVKEGIFNLENEGEDYKIFSNPKKDKFLCVYYNLVEKSFEDFYNKIKSIKERKFIYMFSLNQEVDKSLFSEIKNFSVEAIPENILNLYKELVGMTIKIKPNLIFSELSKAKNVIFEREDKDEGARILRIVLEKSIKKICQNKGINLKNENQKEKVLNTLNAELYRNEILTKLEWKEIETFLVIGNAASHGEYDEYDLEKVKDFYRYCQGLIDKYVS